MAIATSQSGEDPAKLLVNSNEMLFAVGGMSCGGCANRLQRTLDAAEGIRSAEVNFATERARVTIDPGQHDTTSVGRLVTDAGFSANFGDNLAESSGQTGSVALDTESVMLALSMMATVPFLAQMIGGRIGLAFDVPVVLEAALAGFVQIFIGQRFYRGAWAALRQGAANMEALVALGTTAAFAYSLYSWLALSGAGGVYFEASAIIITFVLLGKWLEARGKRLASSAVRELMSLRPNTALLVAEDGEREVPLDALTVGDLVRVRPGGVMPVDGTIVDGMAELDNAHVTGESLPQTVAAGDAVLQGAINISGLVTMRVDAENAQSTVAMIAFLTERAQAGKAPVERLVDRISAVFVPVVLAAAVATFVGWMLVGGSLETAMLSAVAVLVIACPCALGLATPAAITAGLGRAARSGILIRDIDALERAAGVRVVVFDKTGTLTEGRPGLRDCISHLEDLDTEAVLTLAASAQQGSEHPLAVGLRTEAETRGLSLSWPEGFASVTGKGVTATVGGHHLIIGRADFLDAQGIARATGGTLPQPGQTPVEMAVDGRHAASFLFQDTVRAGTASAISELRERGVRTVMLSGDASSTAEAVASDLGLDEARGDLLSADKLEQLDRLRARFGPVAMVGDGINDAPALAAADLGVAMGGGSKAAMETAGATLMRPDPRLVAGLLGLSAATMRTVRQNLFWAFIFNVTGIPLAALGFLRPEIAAGAMAASSLFVVGNALLLSRWKARGIELGAKR